jgi:UDP-N-acetylmuramoyl-tripeptide--D-alanyl-D-alanine ligase
MEVLHVHGITVLNDSYNANPESMLAALAALAEMSVAGKRIAVLGDMRELGAGEIAEHQEIGKDATRLGIEYLLTYGELARQIHASASVPFSAHYEQKSMLAEYLVELLAPGDAVLIKGSRAMRMEDIVTFLLQRLEPVATSA